MPKITELPVLSAATSDDLLPIVDNAGAVTDKVTVAGIASAVVSSTPTNTITAPMLATSAITLGYAQITSNFSTTSGTSTQIPGLSVTVTIPAGGRRVEILVYSVSLSNSTASAVPIVELWDGTVGSGTQISQANGPAANGTSVYVVAVPPAPAAGTKTYNAALRQAFGGTAQFSGQTTAPAFILVRAI